MTDPVHDFFRAHTEPFGRDVIDQPTSLGPSSRELLSQTLLELKGGRVLDLACGDGAVIEACLPHAGAHWSLYALDISPERVARVRERFPCVRAVCQPAHQTSFEDGFFDAVLSHMALMLIQPLEEALLEMARILKPGGRLVAVVGFTKTEGLFDEIRQSARPLLQSALPAWGKKGFGDPRVMDRRAFRRLVASLGCFDEPRFQEVDWLLDMNFATFMAFFSQTYGWYFLDPAQRIALTAEIRSFFPASEQAKVRMKCPIRIIQMHKKSTADPPGGIEAH